MTFQPGAMINTQGFGNRPESVEVPFISNRAPASTDINFPLGKRWIYTNTAEYILLGLTTFNGVTSATWSVVTSLTGALTTITGDSGGAETPNAGNFNLLGTANQIAVAGSANTETFSIPAVFVAPGSVTATSTLTATLGAITATNGNIVRGTAGNKDVYSSVASTTTAGANSAGTVTLVGGTATVATTAVTASSQIRLYRQGIGATGAAALGILTLGTKTAGVSFVINAVQAADATSLQASDVSSIGWEIVN